MTDSYNQRSINLSPSSSGQLSVKNFGAVGNGIANDTAAVQAAFAEAGRLGGAEVYFPTGIYKITSQINLPISVSILGDGDGSVLDFSDGVKADFPNSCLYATGSLTVLPSIANDIDQYDITATLATAPSDLASDDVIILENTTDFSFSLFRSYYHAGEFYHLVSVSGTTLTFDAPSFGAYTVGANISIWKLNPTVISISKIRVIGPGATTPVIHIIGIHLGRNITIENVTGEGANHALINISRCYDTLIRSVRGYDFSDAVGLNYGIIIGNSQKFIVSDCQITTRRHAITTGGGSEDAAVPCRQVLIQQSQLGSLGVYGVGLHGNDEYCEISDCEITGGCALSGDNIKLYNSTVWAEPINGTCLTMGELLGPNIWLVNNEFIAVTNITSSPPALVKWDDGDADPNSLARSGTMRIIGNKMNLGQFTGGAGQFQNRTVQQDIDFEAIDNEMVQNAAAVSTNSVFSPRGNVASDYVWRRIILRGNKSSGISISAQETGAKEIIIQNNEVYGSFSGNIRADSAGPVNPWPSQDVLIENNYSDFAGQEGIQVVGNVGITNVVVCGNTSLRAGQSGSGASGQRTSVTISDVGLVNFYNNTLGDDQGVPTQLRLWQVDDADLLCEYNNLNIGSVTAVTESNITKRIAYVYSSTNQSVSYGSAPPVAGTWLVGDIVFNNAPANGEPQSWSCVTAGTPGTWSPVGQVGHRESAGAPAFNAIFVGEEALDTTGPTWYKSVSVGSGAGDWIAI